MVGGMVSEGRQCCWPPRRMSVSPVLCVVSPLVVYRVALLNGGGVCCDALSSDRVWCLALSHSLSYCLVPFLPLCSPSQHCWFRVVSL